MNLTDIALKKGTWTESSLFFTFHLIRLLRHVKLISAIEHNQCFPRQEQLTKEHERTSSSDGVFYI